MSSFRFCFFCWSVIYFDLEGLFFKKRSFSSSPFQTSSNHLENGRNVTIYLCLCSSFVPEMLVVDSINTPSQNGCYHRSRKAGERVNRHSHSRVTDGVFRAVSGWGWRQPATARPGWGSLEDDLCQIISSPAGSFWEMFPDVIDFRVCPNLTRNKLKTHHDVIPISCLTEFPNVVQMAKVRRGELNLQRLYRVKHCVRFFCSFQARLWRCERGPLFPCPLPKSKIQFGLCVIALECLLKQTTHKIQAKNGQIYLNHWKL